MTSAKALTIKIMCCGPRCTHWSKAGYMPGYRLYDTCYHPKYVNEEGNKAILLDYHATTVPECCPLDEWKESDDPKAIVAGLKEGSRRVIRDMSVTSLRHSTNFGDLIDLKRIGVLKYESCGFYSLTDPLGLAVQKELNNE